MPKPDKTPRREPISRSFVDWDADYLRSALVLADSGSLRMAADFVEALLADDRVQGVLPTRSRGLLGLPLTFEPGGDGRRKGRAVRALEAGEDWWFAFPESELAQLLEWGILLGVGLGELVWTEHEGRVVPRLKVWHPRNLRWDWDSRGWKLNTDAGEIDIAPGDGRWVIYTPYGTSRPWVRGAWRALAKWYLLKEFARQDWARHSELHGVPIRVGTAPPGTSPVDRQKYADDIAEMGRDSSMVPPPGWDLKFAEPVARTWQMFPAEIAEANTAISIVLVGQNLTTEIKGGSFAAATVHSSVKGELIRADGETFSTCLHEQALTWWAEFNFGDRGLAPWPAWDTAPPKPPAPKPPANDNAADTAKAA